MKTLFIDGPRSGEVHEIEDGLKTFVVPVTVEITSSFEGDYTAPNFESVTYHVYRMSLFERTAAIASVRSQPDLDIHKALVLLLNEMVLADARRK